jgi:REP element-mobilizing transposase RayT
LIFLDDGNRRILLDLVAAVRERINRVVHAYCLMTNRYHLLVETPGANLSKGMCQLTIGHLKDEIAVL